MPKLRIETQIDNYLADQEFSETTRTTYRRDLLAFFKFSKGRMPTVDNVKAWLGQMESKDRSSSYISRRHYALKGFCEWMNLDIFAAPHEKSRYKVKAPSVRISDIPETRSLEEVERLFKVCDSPRDKMIMTLLASTGARINELIKMDIYEDIDWENNTLSMIRKGRKGRKDEVVVSEETMQSIKEYLEWRVSRSHLLLPFSYNDIYRSFKALAKRAKVVFPKGSFFHNLRHFFILYQRLSGVDDKDIAKAVGHSSPDITRRMYGKMPAEEIKRQLKSMPWEKGSNA